MTTMTKVYCGWESRAISPFADPWEHPRDAACGNETTTIYCIFGRLTPVCAECAGAAIRAGAYALPQGREEVTR